LLIEGNKKKKASLFKNPGEKGKTQRGGRGKKPSGWGLNYWEGAATKKKH